MKTRIWYLDAARVVSIIAVVFLHTSNNFWYYYPVDSLRWEFANVINSLTRWAVPVFVMISGALFLNTKKSISIRGLFRKNILHIAILILFWGVFYALTSISLTNLSLGTLVDFFLAALQGHYHMWFLYMIIGLYVITPLLRQITASPMMTRYFLILSFLSNSLFPFLGTFEQLSPLNDFYNKFIILLPSGYSFYYVLGYYVSTTGIDRKGKSCCIGLGVLGGIATIALTSLTSHNAHCPTETYYNNLFLPVTLLSICIFIIFKEVSPLLFPENAKHTFLRRLSEETLGVYLIHPLVLQAVWGLDLQGGEANPALLIIGMCLFVSTASFLIANLLKKVPMIREYLL